MEKMLAKGEGWLAGHPEKEEIARPYLKFQPSLFWEALARLVEEEEPVTADEGERPADRAVGLTTPNREYNVKWETLEAGPFRHPDHRLDWTRRAFQEWARGIAERFGSTACFVAGGPEDEKVGAPTQMGSFPWK